MFLSSFSFFMLKPSIFFCFILMIPMILDGMIQMFTKYESNNLKRFVTGIFFGYSIISLFIISTIATYDFGKTFRSKF